MREDYHSPFEPALDQALQPHRGRLILILGILGFLSAGILGGLAWHLGNLDLRKMNVGIMDDSGIDKTEYGRILGIISVCLWVVGVLILGIWLAGRIPTV